MELGAYKTIVPISNGPAEVYVQIVKNCLHSMSGERGTLQYKLLRLIVQLRQSKNYTGTFSFIWRLVGKPERIYNFLDQKLKEQHTQIK